MKDTKSDKNDWYLGWTEIDLTFGLLCDKYKQQDYLFSTFVNISILLYVFW